MKNIFFFIGLLLSAGISPGIETPSFSLRGDRLSFRSEGVSMREFLRRFHAAGVRVRMDPDISEEFVSGEISEEPMETALDQIAAGFDYALFWSEIRGPAGPIKRLAELWIFRRGRADLARSAFGSRPLRVSEIGSTRFVQGELLIGFRAGMTRDRVEEILRGIGGEIVGGQPEIGVYRIRLPDGANIPEIAAMLARNPLVAAVEPNFVMALPRLGSTAGTPAWNPGSGPPTEGSALVAVLDSGVRTLDGLNAWISGQYNSFDASASPEDHAGHGTQMALIAAGLVSPVGTEDGLFGNRKVLSIKGFNEDGLTHSWAVLEALRLASEHGVRVMNLSWGSDEPSVFLHTALQHAARNGLILVAAAGNEATGRPVYPAAFPGVLAVGAANSDGTPSAYSNFGSFVDLSAPAMAQFTVGYKGPPGAYTGTSIASAFTAGILAEYLAKHPEIQPAAALQRLRESLSPLPASPSRHGAGVLDAAAVQRFLGP